MAMAQSVIKMLTQQVAIQQQAIKVLTEGNEDCEALNNFMNDFMIAEFNKEQNNIKMRRYFSKWCNLKMTNELIKSQQKCIEWKDHHDEVEEDREMYKRMYEGLGTNLNRGNIQALMGVWNLSVTKNETMRPYYGGSKDTQVPGHHHRVSKLYFADKIENTIDIFDDLGYEIEVALWLDNCPNVILKNQNELPDNYNTPEDDEDLSPNVCMYKHEPAGVLIRDMKGLEYLSLEGFIEWIDCGEVTQEELKTAIQDNDIDYLQENTAHENLLFWTIPAYIPLWQMNSQVTEDKIYAIRYVVCFND